MLTKRVFLFCVRKAQAKSAQRNIWRELKMWLELSIQTASHLPASSCWLSSMEYWPWLNQKIHDILGICNLQGCSCRLDPKEWALLDTSLRKLYRAVMLENISHLVSEGAPVNIQSFLYLWNAYPGQLPHMPLCCLPWFKSFCTWMKSVTLFSSNVTQLEYSLPILYLSAMLSPRKRTVLGIQWVFLNE